MRQRPRELMKDRTLRFLLTVQFETVVILQLLGLRFKSIDTECNQFSAFSSGDLVSCKFCLKTHIPQMEFSNM